MKSYENIEDAVRGMDVIVDKVGDDTSKRAFEAVKQGGFLVTVVGFPTVDDKQHGIGDGQTKRLEHEDRREALAISAHNIT